MVSGLLNYTTRAAKLFPDFILGTSAETMGAAMRGTQGSLFTKLRAGGRALEAEVAANTALHGGFFSRTVKGLASAPKDIANAASQGASLAKLSGKSALSGGFKGALKGIGKKLPVVGSVLTIALEAPNIFRAFKEGGLIAGLKEVAGAAVELGAMAAGAAIGSAICPGVGTVVGGILGGIVGLFARGKSHSEKQDEINAVKEQLKTKCGLSDDEIKDIEEHKFDEKYIEQVLKEKADKQLIEAGLTEEQIEQIAKNGYNDEDIEAAICENYNNELKAAGLTDAQISTIAAKGYQEADIQKAIDLNNELISKLQQAGVPSYQIEQIVNNGFNESEIKSAILQAQQLKNMYSNYSLYNSYGFNTPYLGYNNNGLYTNPYYQYNLYNNYDYYTNPNFQYSGYGQMNDYSRLTDTLNPYAQYPIYN